MYNNRSGVWGPDTVETVSTNLDCAHQLPAWGVWNVTKHDL